MSLTQKLERFTQRFSVSTINRYALMMSWLWLIIVLPFSIIHRPTIPDFGQFYMGGVLAQEGEWESIYPVPIRGSLDNPGLNMHSRAKSKWLNLSKTRRVQDYTHFILPPPTALLFVPLSYLTYSQAFWVWTYFLIVCVWSVAWISGRLLRQIVGKPSHLEGALAILIALSPMTARAVRISNVSPPIAVLIGLVLISLVRQNQPIRGAIALFLGAMLKYATLILLPLLLAMRRWKMIYYLAICGVASVLITLYFSGIDPFIEFFQVISPTLSRPSWFYGNQSLPGLFSRLFGRPFPPLIIFLINEARFLTISAILYLLFKLPVQAWKNPIHIFAATGVLISWLLIFSPIAWEHWPIFFCPIWGWIFWEARKKGFRRVIALTSFILMYFPAGIIQVPGIATYPFVFPEPLNSSQLFGLIFLLGLSSWRLYHPIEVKQTTGPLRILEDEEIDIDRLKYLNLTG